MELKTINSNEMITLNDFPVHNLHILKIYFKIFKDGYSRIIPPCPVLNKKLVVSAFDGKLLDNFNKFEKKNPQAKYFLLDGSHKTTAANLTSDKIKVMIFETDTDISEAKELAKIGELFSLTVDNSIMKNVKSLQKHFSKRLEFQTVEEKTRKMIQKRVIPDYMIKFYKNKE